MAESKKKRSKPERVSGITNAKDRREALDVYIRAFTGSAHMENHMCRSLWRGALGDMDYTRVAVADGRVVSAVTMGPRMIRFGPVTVPAMTIGPVGTHDHHRKQGYGLAAMNDATKYMRENGFLVAYLQGIPNYYHRYGYYPYMARTSATLDRENAKKEGAAGKLRAMTREDLPKVAKLYESATAGRICASVRDSELWGWLFRYGTKTWLFRSPRVIIDGAGRLCGYLTVDSKDRLDISEVIVRQDEASHRAALGAIVREARRREVKQISLAIPWDEPLAVFLRQYVGCEFKMSSNPTGDLLLKIVDFPALMQKLQPLFTRRRRAARSGLPEVGFTLASEIGSVGFTVGRSNVSVGPPVRGTRAYIPQRWLSGLLTGYYPVKDIAPRKKASIPSRLLPVLDILFPAGWPWTFKGDNY